MRNYKAKVAFIFDLYSTMVLWGVYVFMYDTLIFISIYFHLCSAFA